MQKYLQNNEQVSDGVNLLISILVRYPEIGTIAYQPESTSIKLTFLISQDIRGNEFTYLRKLLLNSIAAYNILENRNSITADVNLSLCEKNVCMLTIARDVNTLSKGEMALIITLLREKLQDRLIADTSEMHEDEMLMQEELIENMLENIKTQYAGNALIGIREDGRVLVYNK